MATLNIQVSKSGVDRVSAGSSTVAGSVELGQLIEATALPLRLLDTAVVEYFDGKSTDREAEVEPEVLIQTDRDGEHDLPRKIKVQVGVLPRDPFDAPPAWFDEDVRRLFPNVDWANAEAPISKDELLSWHSKEYIAKHKHLSEVQLNELADPPYCTRTAEKAVSLFDSQMSDVLDRWGWVDDILVAEPYGINLDGIKKLTSLCEQASWTFSIAGKSGHYPSATLRIEIKPNRGLK